MTCVAHCADGVPGDGVCVCVCDPPLGRRKRRGASRDGLVGHAGSVSALEAFGPTHASSGLLLASASYDKTIRLWGAASGGTPRAIGSASSESESEAFAGKPPAAPRRLPRVRVLSKRPAGGGVASVATLAAHAAPVLTLARRGVFLASGDRGGAAALWDASSASLVAKWDGAHRGTASPRDSLTWAPAVFESRVAPGRRRPSRGGALQSSPGLVVGAAASPHRGAGRRRARVGRAPFAAPPQTWAHARAGARARPAN